MNIKLTGIIQGDRVEIHPAVDAWMRGDRYGTVTKVGRALFSVKMDKSQKTLRIAPHNILRNDGQTLPPYGEQIRIA